MTIRRKTSRSSDASTAKPKRRTRTLIRVKRVYEESNPADGMRVLVDRLWPRGLSRSQLKLDRWVKHLAPSNELRRWYRHDPNLFDEFRRRYLAELEAHRDGVVELRLAVRGRAVTLLTATRELALSHAEVLRDLLTTTR
jgi:uncharacterized protein YeaO (DUF488 family)